MLRVPSPSAKTYRWLMWTPFGVATAWLAVLGVLGELQFDLLLAALAGGLGVLAWAGRRLWVQAFLFAALLAPLGWHFLVSLPAAEAFEGVAPGAWLAVEGTIRDRWTLASTQGDKAARLLLGEVQLERGPERRNLAEAVVEFPAESAWRFTSGRRLRLAGPLARAMRVEHRLRLVLSDADWHFVGASYAPHGFETLRARLRARAAYYLGKPAQAVYLPLVLDLRERASPEGRAVIGAFRRVGISHLFAISGLNISMIFGLLMVVQRYVTWILPFGRDWVHGRNVARFFIVALIWAYIALIGYPVTAVRAAVMGSLLIWTDLWGTRTPGLYVLVLTGLSMVALTPSVLYDISFQLSFLAYFFLVQAMDLGRALRYEGPVLLEALGLHISGDSPEPDRTIGWSGAVLGWLGRLGAACAENLWVTGIVTLGLWPLMAARFHNLSLLAFAGNLLLVPAMELALLPLAMAALATSALFATAAPGVWLERAVFGALELGLSGWARVVYGLDRLGGAFYLRIHLDWTFAGFALYYGVLLAALRGCAWIARRSRQRRAFGGAG
ncbi:MAG: ComEC/Rec2 family competence protein [SAR324 cluster bacterium]